MFVDLKAAYDWIVRTWLFRSIFNRIDRENTGLNHLIKLIENIYCETRVYMENKQESFETTSGLIQGGTESPALFNLFLDYIMRIYINDVKQIGINLEHRFPNQTITRDQRQSGCNGPSFTSCSVLQMIFQY